MTVTVTFPNGVSWTRDFDQKDENFRRDGNGVVYSMDFDFSMSVVEMILEDSGLFTAAEASLITWRSEGKFAELVADVLAKRPQA